jgi:FtsH-binding integral membrane protein
MALANIRPIDGAVATLGVSERVAFLRKTYAHLAVALVGFAVIAGGMIRYMTETSFKFSAWAFTGQYHWLAVIGAFMIVGFVTDRLAKSNTSRGIQYVGLTLAVIAEGIILQPMLWVLFMKYGKPADFVVNDAGNVTSFVTSGMAVKVLMESIIITLTIFIGLSATVFVTKKDFSFLRGALVIASFAALGVILASMLFGFSLGALFAGIMVLVMAGFILYQTSLILKEFPPTAYVAAALMLFSTIATLFWYVLRLMMALNRR